MFQEDIRNSNNIIHDNIAHPASNMPRIPTLPSGLLTSLSPPNHWFSSNPVDSDSEAESVASAGWDVHEHVLDGLLDNASVQFLPEWPAPDSAMPNAAITNQAATNTPSCWQTDSNL